MITKMLSMLGGGRIEMNKRISQRSLNEMFSDSDIKVQLWKIWKLVPYSLHNWKTHVHCINEAFNLCSWHTVKIQIVDILLVSKTYSHAMHGAQREEKMFWGILSIRRKVAEKYPMGYEFSSSRHYVSAFPSRTIVKPGENYGENQCKTRVDVFQIRLLDLELIPQMCCEGACCLFLAKRLVP